MTRRRHSTQNVDEAPMRWLIAAMFCAILLAGPALAQSPVDFAGAWDTTYGRMTLTQAESKVDGTYAYGNTEGTISGTVEGRRLTFTYSDVSDRGEGNFDLAPDGRSFTGRWRKEGGSAWQAWSGTRPNDSGPWSFDGLWQTSYGRMRLRLDGDNVTGVYAWSGVARMTGKLDDRALKFRYEEPNGVNGEGTFTLAEDGQSFTGTWTPDKGNGGEWKGRRVLPESGRKWLVVLEAHWESSLVDVEYSYGQMLRTFLTRLPNTQVRHRFFQDESDLRRWCGELAFLAEPVVLYISSHGSPAGVANSGNVIKPATFADLLKDGGDVRLLHFGACAVMDGPGPRELLAALPADHRFPISGFNQYVDWAGSAVVDFTYLDLVLGRGMAPSDAVEQTRKMLSFAREQSDAVVPGCGLTIVTPDEPAR